MTSLLEKWLTTVEAKNSVLCAGLDPAEFEMGRGNESLPEGTDKVGWALRYIEAVAPYCAAVKPNVQYWKNTSGMEHLRQIVELAAQKGLLVIDDSKLADIGTTNDAGMFHTVRKGFDAVTIAPYAGNMKEAAAQGQARGLGIITMCLMSNPEYAQEKGMLVSINDAEVENFLEEHTLRLGHLYRSTDAQRMLGIHVPRYVKIAQDARQYGVDGIVIGAPSAKNHITSEEIRDVRHYVGDDMLVLLPGVGAQGGEAGAIWQHFAINRVIVNVGRALMFPESSGSTSDDHRRAAQYYQNMLNKLRS